MEKIIAEIKARTFADWVEEIKHWMPIIIEAVKAMIAGIQDPDSVLLPEEKE